jgi:hypothetical protein
VVMTGATTLGRNRGRTEKVRIHSPPTLSDLHHLLLWFAT